MTRRESVYLHNWYLMKIVTLTNASPLGLFIWIY